jgi:hypothetical protein
MDAGRVPPRRIRIVARNDPHRDLRLDIDGMSYEVNTYKWFKSYFFYQYVDMWIIGCEVSSLLKNKKLFTLQIVDFRNFLH